MPRIRGSGGRFRANPRRRGLFTDGLTPGLAAYGAYMMSRVREAMREWAADAVEYMKSNAEWEDRTGDARSGLDWAMAEHPVHPEILLFYGVDYGIWLEVRWGGRYAIITPTMEEFGPELIDYIERKI